METKTDILNELNSISPLIEGMDKVNVFTVPQGYFDSISATVIACLREKQIIPGVAGNTPLLSVPEGYFEGLAGSILERIKNGEKASDEIRNLSPLLHSIRDNNVFELPAGYFEGFGRIITDKIKTTGSEEAFKSISPLLHSIQSKNVFEVPDGYFASLAGDILEKVNPSTAKVVPMPRRNLVIKYAVAAMLTGVTALGIYKYVEKPANMPVETVAALDASIEKGKNMDDKQFNETLENLNDADIAKYLENNGDITDVAALNSNLDETKLPSQDDYLIDETTLEDYLREIEKTTVNN